MSDLPEEQVVVPEPLPRREDFSVSVSLTITPATMLTIATILGRDDTSLERLIDKREPR